MFAAYLLTLVVWGVVAFAILAAMAGAKPNVKTQVMLQNVEQANSRLFKNLWGKL